ncbi:MAG: hypothetical protein CSA76_05470 [Spirochaetales bacterium]|nr:MAG: hypothetical protein CSA76_05470 [Spirochaetales bacterium]
MLPASIRNNQLNVLARRAGYNLALRHFRTAQGFAGDIGDGFNLADVLNEALKAERIQEFQIRPILNILLAEKFGYSFVSENLKNDVEDISNPAKIISSWTNLQVVLVYTDTNLGIHLLNPEVPESWEAALPLSCDEHVVCYVGSQNEVDSSVLTAAARDVFTLLYGGRIRSKAAYRASSEWKQVFKAPEEPPAPAPSAAAQRAAAHMAASNEAESASGAPDISMPPSGGSRKLTAKIAVNVTNELFHNGNVEAWKRIIESYRFKYPQLDVLIWYEGERINDINALFKWGKVKHGTPIMFSVAGDNPRDISRLRKYLFEGASQRFEAFLHGGPGTILQLF